MKNGIFYIFAAAAQAFYKKRSPETINFRAPFPQSVLPYQELLGNYNLKAVGLLSQSVLPYQELLGNYNNSMKVFTGFFVLPYQELLGNYNISEVTIDGLYVLPYQELLGNYNTSAAANDTGRCFTIPRTARELQQPCNRLLQASGIYHTKNCEETTTMG